MLEYSGGHPKHPMKFSTNGLWPNDEIPPNNDFSSGPWYWWQ